LGRKLFGRPSLREKKKGETSTSSVPDQQGKKVKPGKTAKMKGGQRERGTLLSEAKTRNGKRGRTGLKSRGSTTK